MNALDDRDAVLHIKSGGSAEAEGGGFLETEIGRLERNPAVFWHGPVLGMAAHANPGIGKDLVADLEFCDIVADGCDLSGKL